LEAATCPTSGLGPSWQAGGALLRLALEASGFAPVSPDRQRGFVPPLTDAPTADPGPVPADEAQAGRARRPLLRKRGAGRAGGRRRDVVRECAGGLRLVGKTPLRAIPSDAPVSRTAPGVSSERPVAGVRARPRPTHFDAAGGKRANDPDGRREGRARPAERRPAQEANRPLKGQIPGMRSGWNKPDERTHADVTRPPERDRRDRSTAPEWEPAGERTGGKASRGRRTSGRDAAP
jgi:hypothetical protein